MKKYTLLFEFYGHRMKTTVEAATAKEAMQAVRNRVTFVKVHAPEPKRPTATTDRPPGFDDLFQSFKKR
jgi:hypothetical protein